MTRNMQFSQKLGDSEISIFFLHIWSVSIALETEISNSLLHGQIFIPGGSDHGSGLGVYEPDLEPKYGWDRCFAVWT